MSVVREYDAHVRVRVATYMSDLEVKAFCNFLAAQLERCCAEHQNIIATDPTVEVNYATKR